MATVKVLLFARLAELAGTREIELEIGDGLTAGDAYRLLVQQDGSLAGFKSSLAYAVNREYVDAEAPLQDGDELALIPPVSGGSGPCRYWSLGALSLPTHPPRNVYGLGDTPKPPAGETASPAPPLCDRSNRTMSPLAHRSGRGVVGEGIDAV